MPRTLLTAASTAGTAALLIFAVSACGGSSTPSTATPTSGAQQQNQSGGPGLGSGGGQGFPGASGKVAAITGNTLQVQSAQSGQVAVTYTAKTTFTEAVKASAAAVKVGGCVSVRSTAAPGTTTTATDRVTAASLQLSDPVKGECGVRGGFAGGGGFGGGGFGGGAGANGGGTRPSGAPTGAPGSVRGTGGFGGARPVSGRVTAVDGSTITVAAVTFGAGRGAGATASPAATPSTNAVEVTTTTATTYTKTVSASAKNLAVGQCVTAIGSANDTGAVTATLIASQPAVAGECSTGFGARRPGAGAGGTS